jgi:hypothetical protein
MRFCARASSGAKESMTQAAKRSAATRLMLPTVCVMRPANRREMRGCVLFINL